MAGGENKMSILASYTFHFNKPIDTLRLERSNDRFSPIDPQDLDQIFNDINLNLITAILML